MTLPVSTFVNVGERTNVTGSAKFRRLITEGDYAEAVSIARQQVENGAQIIDVNMDEGLLDSVEAMTTFLRLIAGEPDRDGDIFASPADWSAPAAPPQILYVPRRGDPALGPGDRFLAKLRPVEAGDGLTGGGTSGDVVLDVDPTVVQTRVNGSCLPGHFIQAIQQFCHRSFVPIAAKELAQPVADEEAQKRGEGQNGRDDRQNPEGHDQVGNGRRHAERAKEAQRDIHRQAAGYRGPEIRDADPPPRRVLCLGDSNFFGYPLDDEHVFPRVLAETHAAVHGWIMTDVTVSANTLAGISAA